MDHPCMGGGLGAWTTRAIWSTQRIGAQPGPRCVDHTGILRGPQGRLRGSKYPPHPRWITQRGSRGPRGPRWRSVRGPHPSPLTIAAGTTCLHGRKNWVQGRLRGPHGVFWRGSLGCGPRTGGSAAHTTHPRTRAGPRSHLAHSGTRESVRRWEGRPCLGGCGFGCLCVLFQCLCVCKCVLVCVCVCV